MERDALLAELRRVFPARRPEPFPPLTLTPWGSDARRAADAFADATDWTALDSAWLHGVPNADNGLTEARSFLSPAALCFYLPAYLAAALALELEPVGSLTWGFDAGTRDRPPSGTDPAPGTSTERARACWAGLTREQAGAVARFLAWRVDLNGPEWDRDAAEALAFYWRPRAEGAWGADLPALPQPACGKPGA